VTTERTDVESEDVKITVWGFFGHNLKRTGSFESQSEM